MGRISYFHAFSGMSGDMTVGALVDAGADSAVLIQALDSLGIGASFEFAKVKRCGIGAMKFRVVVPESKRHRHLPEILRMIAASTAPPRAMARAVAVFEHLREAEATVHQMHREKVHFHEIGSADSIADIVGTCVALELAPHQRCSRCRVALRRRQKVLCTSSMSAFSGFSGTQFLRWGTGLLRTKNLAVLPRKSVPEPPPESNGALVPTDGLGGLFQGGSSRGGIGSVGGPPVRTPADRVHGHARAVSKSRPI